MVRLMKSIVRRICPSGHLSIASWNNSEPSLSPLHDVPKDAGIDRLHDEPKSSQEGFCSQESPLVPIDTVRVKVVTVMVRLGVSVLARQRLVVRTTAQESHQSSHVAGKGTDEILGMDQHPHLRQKAEDLVAISPGGSVIGRSHGPEALAGEDHPPSGDGPLPVLHDSLQFGNHPVIVGGHEAVPE